MIGTVLLGAAFWSMSTVSALRCELAACRCIDAAALGQTPAEFVHARRDRAERVVLGTVSRIDTLSRVTWGTGKDQVALRPIVARVAVRRVWRGPITDTMTVMVTSVERRSSCDLQLVVGQSYVIFASRTGGGPLATRQCSGTEEERAAGPTLSVLGPGQQRPLLGEQFFSDSTLWQRVLTHVVTSLSTYQVRTGVDSNLQPWHMSVPDDVPQRDLLLRQLRTILRARPIASSDTLIFLLIVGPLTIRNDTAHVTIRTDFGKRCPGSTATGGFANFDSVVVPRDARAGWAVARSARVFHGDRAACSGPW
jgi:hypothetical protein